MDFILIITLVSVAVPVLIVFALVRANQQRARLLASGEPAMAAIVQIWETGTYINNQPQVGFLLEVRPNTRPPFQVRTQMVVSMLQIPRLQPGAIVPVRFNPANPAECTIVV